VTGFSVPMPMPMAQSPAVARLFVRVALKGAREIGAMTQTDVAKSLDWSLSKVQRIESGEVAVTKTDLMAMVRHYDNLTSEDAERLVELVRVSRKGTGWWDEYKGLLTASFVELIQFENEAAVIRVYNPLVMPGLLQTRSYRSSVIDKWMPDIDPEHKEIKLKVLESRKRNFVVREPRPHYQVLLDESVLRRELGVVDVMVGQLRDLLRVMDAGHVELGILKHDTELPARANSFILLRFGSTDSVLYEEAFPNDQVITDPEQIRSHGRIFDRMWQGAAQGEDARSLIERRLVELAAR